MMIRRMFDLPNFGYSHPFSDMERVREQMSRLFEGVSAGRQTTAGVFPLLNVTEDKEGYRVRAELPGIQAEELEITVTGNSLAISGERKIAEEDKNAKYHRREREAGTFRRIINLPGEIDPDKVEANCKEGILTITLPKAEKAKPRQITVK